MPYTGVSVSEVREYRCCCPPFMASGAVPASSSTPHPPTDDTPETDAPAATAPGVSDKGRPAEIVQSSACVIDVSLDDDNDSDEDDNDDDDDDDNDGRGKDARSITPSTGQSMGADDGEDEDADCEDEQEDSSVVRSAESGSATPKVGRTQRKPTTAARAQSVSLGTKAGAHTRKHRSTRQCRSNDSEATRRQRQRRPLARTHKEEPRSQKQTGRRWRQQQSDGSSTLGPIGIDSDRDTLLLACTESDTLGWLETSDTDSGIASAYGHASDPAGINTDCGSLSGDTERIEEAMIEAIRQMPRNYACKGAPSDSASPCSSTVSTPSRSQSSGTPRPTVLGRGRRRDETLSSNGRSSSSLNYTVSTMATHVSLSSLDSCDDSALAPPSYLEATGQVPLARPALTLTRESSPAAEREYVSVARVHPWRELASAVDPTGRMPLDVSLVWATFDAHHQENGPLPFPGADGTRRETMATTATAAMTTALALPAQFDGRQRWAGLLTVPRDQDRSGACWAHAAVGVLADRAALWTMRAVRPWPDGIARPDVFGATLSVRSLIDRNNNNNNRSRNDRDGPHEGVWRGDCGNNNADMLVKANGAYHGPHTRDHPQTLCGAFDTLYVDGVMCPSEPPWRCRSLGHYGLASHSETDIKAELFCWGPVATVMDLYEDFVYPHLYPRSWEGGVYRHQTKTQEGPSSGTVGGKGTAQGWAGGHAVVLVGWCQMDLSLERLVTSEGVSERANAMMGPAATFQRHTCWIARHAWGQQWDAQLWTVTGQGPAPTSLAAGHFLIASGQCSLESNVVACVPDIGGLSIDDARLSRRVAQMSEDASRRRAAVPWNQAHDLAGPVRVDMHRLPAMGTFVAGEQFGPLGFRFQHHCLYDPLFVPLAGDSQRSSSSWSSPSPSHGQQHTFDGSESNTLISPSLDPRSLWTRALYSARTRPVTPSMAWSTSSPDSFSLSSSSSSIPPFLMQNTPSCAPLPVHNNHDIAREPSSIHQGHQHQQQPQWNSTRPWPVPDDERRATPTWSHQTPPLPAHSSPVAWQTLQQHREQHVDHDPYPPLAETADGCDVDGQDWSSAPDICASPAFTHDGDAAYSVCNPWQSPAIDMGSAAYEGETHGDESWTQHRRVRFVEPEDWARSGGGITGQNHDRPRDKSFYMDERVETQYIRDGDDVPAEAGYSFGERDVYHDRSAAHDDYSNSDAEKSDEERRRIHRLRP